MMDPDRSSRTLFGVAGGGLGCLFVAAAMVGTRGGIANVNVALVLVLIVLGAAAVGGRTAGAMSGLVAATSFDFFHTRPYGSLKIARPDDLLTTLLLLAVGLAAGSAAERSSRFRMRMREDQRHLRRLHRVTTLALSDAGDERDLVLAVTAELIDALRLADCSFELPPFARTLPSLALEGTSAADRTHGEPKLPDHGVELRVVGRAGTIGRFVLVPQPNMPISPDRSLVAAALAQELGLALAAGPA